ncbi:MAG: hypothetical protein IKI24_08375 [Clostridia bacterium]|nr:hypothetical protein [Clostridia bacterium]MCR4578453.1 YciI family protein [Clostridiales bacterium]
MQFIVTAKDGENMLAKRMEVRPRHLENMERMKEHIVCAGGLLDEEGKMAGSVLILDFASRGELDAYLEKEPYVTEGVWRQVDVQKMNVVIVKGEKVK